jgi:N utilization substance protein A
MDEISQSMEVIVPDDYLSVAIGKRGQNVRLASKLTGWGIDVKSESQYSHAMKAGYESLLALPGMGASTADVLCEYGVYSVDDLANTTVDELVQIKGIGETKAVTLLEAAQKALAEVGEENDDSRKETEEESLSASEGENEPVGTAEDPVEDSSEDLEVSAAEDQVEDSVEDLEVADDTAMSSENQ